MLPTFHSISIRGAQDHRKNRKNIVPIQRRIPSGTIRKTNCIGCRFQGANVPVYLEAASQMQKYCLPAQYQKEQIDFLDKQMSRTFGVRMSRRFSR